MSRRANDGNETGYKLDRFRNSRFERNSISESNANYNRGVTRRTLNTLGGLINDFKGQRGRGPRGYKRSDDSIYEDVCDMLSRSPDVDASDIEVSIKEGIVYLNGTVSDRETKKMAELELENVSGVVDVQNLLNFKRIKKEFH